MKFSNWHWKAEPWEDGDYILTLNGRPVGYTLSEQEAKRIQAFLMAVFHELAERRASDL